MKENPLRTAFGAAKPALNGWLSTADPNVAMAMAAAGYDSLTVDLQHGFGDVGGAVTLLNATALGGVATIARIPWKTAKTEAMTMLDLGVNGLVCPMVENAAEAHEFVEFSSYPPRGYRSYGPWRAQVAWGADYTKVANDQIVLIAQIETDVGFGNLAEIIATPGIDAIYFGPMDYAMSIDKEPVFDTEEPHIYDLLKPFVTTAHKVGKWAGMHTVSVPYALKMAELGFDFVTCGSDIGIVSGNSKKMVAEFRRQSA